jgi:predicted nucleic acid-binding protein
VPETVSDTSPLQYLFQTNLLDLLRVLYTQITVPEAVVDEIAAGHALGIHLPDLTTIPWIQVRQVRDPALLPLAPDLGAGEREVLALAVETADSLALLDDGLARRHARLLKITFTGTLGVLLKGKQQGHLPAVAPVLDELEALGFRLDAATRMAVLKLAQEC